MKSNIYNVMWQCIGQCIGQTGRFSHTGIIEHARSIKNYKINTTALAQYVHNFEHSFDFKVAKILEQKDNFLKTLCLEMIHIQKSNNRTDVENLSDVYVNIIKLFK